MKDRVEKPTIKIPLTGDTPKGVARRLIELASQQPDTPTVAPITVALGTHMTLEDARRLLRLVSELE